MIIKSLPLAINCISFGSALTSLQLGAALCERTCHFVCDLINLQFTDELENKLENFPNIIPKFPNINRRLVSEGRVSKVELVELT